MKQMSPELIAQLVDPGNAHLSAGSNTSVQWRCATDPRHVWSAAPNTRHRSPKCPVCLNKVVLPGVNDLATTHPDLAAQLASRDNATHLHSGSSNKVEWTCLIDPTHQWTASVVSRTRLNSGCPMCSGRLPVPGVSDLATTHPHLVSRLADPSLATTLGAGSAKKLTWICEVDPSHTWSASVRNVVGGPNRKPTSCPHCAGRGQRDYSRQPTLSQLNSPLLDEAVDPDRVAMLTAGSGKIVAWRCSQCAGGHEYQMSVRHRMRGQGCPVVAGVQIMAGVNDLATTHPEIARQLVDPTMATAVSRGSVEITQWQCDAGHVWGTPVYARVAGNGCPECCPIGSSYAEQEMFAALQTLDPSATHRSPVASRLEVDALVGSTAFEFNGIYWHSEAAGRGRLHHSKKLAALRDRDLSLITVWEDDWTNLARRAILVRTFAHRLRRLDALPAALLAAGIPPSTDTSSLCTLAAQRRGARSLTPVELSGTQARKFFEHNHIQGAVALTRTFALVDENNAPRAALGLRSPTHSSRANRDIGQWEIQRYATSSIVPGGFTRLLAHAHRALHKDGIEVTSWVTLSTNESSDGALYKAAGFHVDGHVPPSYWYAGGPQRAQRAPKEAYQLKRFRTDPNLLWQDSWTEREAAQHNGLYRVYDSGKTRWVKDVAL